MNECQKHFTILVFKFTTEQLHGEARLTFSPHVLLFCAECEIH